MSKNISNCVNHKDIYVLLCINYVDDQPILKRNDVRFEPYVN